MIQCIACVIGHYLFHLKLICPYIDGIFSTESNIRFLLFNHNIHALKHAINHGYYVKAFHHNRIFSRLQLIKCEKIFYKLIHFSRFIYNDIAVKLTAFRIIGNILIQPFCISLNQCDRRFSVHGKRYQETPYASSQS